MTPKTWIIAAVLGFPMLGTSQENPAPKKAPLATIVLTSHENGLVPEAEFRCQGTIHGYLRLARRESGAHVLVSRWTSPAHKLAADSRTPVDFRPARSTAYVWFRFPERSAIPGSPDPQLDQELLSYNGRWLLEVLWDGQSILQTEFNVHCP